MLQASNLNANTAWIHLFTHKTTHNSINSNSVCCIISLRLSTHHYKDHFIILSGPAWWWWSRSHDEEEEDYYRMRMNTEQSITEWVKHISGAYSAARIILLVMMVIIIMMSYQTARICDRMREKCIAIEGKAKKTYFEDGWIRTYVWHLFLFYILVQHNHAGFYDGWWIIS